MFSRFHALTRKEDGFTLLEIVVATFIFALAALIFAGMVPISAKTAYLNGQYAQAVSIAQNKIDELRQIGYGRLTLTELKAAGRIDNNSATLPYPFTATDNVANSLPSGTGTINITTVTPPVAGTQAMQVVVTVTWKPVSYSTRTDSVSMCAQIMQCE